MSCGKWKCLIEVLFYITLGLIFVIYNLWLVQKFSRFSCYSGGVSERQREVLKKMSSQLDTLKQRHLKLVHQIKKTSLIHHKPNATEELELLHHGYGPAESYEFTRKLRHRIYSNTKDLCYYFYYELKIVASVHLKASQKWATMMEEVTDRKRSLLLEQEKLSQLDGYQDYRRNEAAAVSALVQRRLHYLQNPPDCRAARKALCFHDNCGFGCQLHHIVYCLIVAYATERTLILQSEWKYNDQGWESMFHPVSDTCTIKCLYNDSVVKIGDGYEYGEEKNVYLPNIDTVRSRLEFIQPLAIPEDLIHRIFRFNGDPLSWWVGQMIKYILKPRAAIQRTINEIIKNNNKTKSPIVGVHVRRTDKIFEAKYHYIEEYMSHVEEFYSQLEDSHDDRRRVYLATDDADVLEDARIKYPQYSFIGDSSIADTAALNTRSTPQALIGLLIDIHMLASCDYIVCTFSSNVGRVVYEMMQTNRVDASSSVISLDNVYAFDGNDDRTAVMEHFGMDDELNFRVNDRLDVTKRYTNGYGYGKHLKTKKVGIFPWYKTEKRFEVYPYPDFKQLTHPDTRCLPHSERDTCYFG